MNAVNELEVLCHAPADVRPLKVRQLAPFATALRELPQEVVDGLMAGSIDVLAVAECMPQLVKAIAIATERNEAELGDMDPEQLFALAMRVVEVNTDFFVRRLLPLIEVAADRITAALGSSSSSASSATATDAKTS